MSVFLFNSRIPQIPAVFLVASLLLLVGCQKNHPPVITSISLEQELTSAGKIHTFKVEAFDEDEDILEYLWSAEGGEFVSAINEEEVQWKSPADGEDQVFSIQVTVSDEEFQATEVYDIQLTEAILGGITGFAYYAYCQIPISDALVKIGDQEVYTNSYGKYHLIGLVAGIDTMRVSKDDFASQTIPITIPANSVITRNIELISIIHTCKVYGQIADQNRNLISGAEVVFLNPDRTESRLQAFTGDDGIYRIPYVPHGGQTILVKKPISNDFRYAENMQRIVLSEEEQRHDFSLQKIPLSGVYTDTRDNHKYPFRTIGEQTWMIMNLAYLPSVTEPSNRSEIKAYYYVYGYEGADTAAAKATSFYEDLGVLYNWEAATTACPSGWRLSSSWDWHLLIQELDPDAGDKMKTNSGWVDHGGGSNSSGFSAIPAGYLTSGGDFRRYGAEAFFYSSSEESITSGRAFRLIAGYNTVMSSEESKKVAYSVRCIKN